MCHKILGVVTRAFLNGTISGIYDWVGSLSRTLEHFRLTTFPWLTLYPKDQIVTVKNTIINMMVVGEPIPLSRDNNSSHIRPFWPYGALSLGVENCAYD